VRQFSVKKVINPYLLKDSFPGLRMQISALDRKRCTSSPQTSYRASRFVLFLAIFSEKDHPIIVFHHISYQSSV